jgi:glycerophosphoryl diester phosphodiesterase
MWSPLRTSRWLRVNALRAAACWVLLGAGAAAAQSSGTVTPAPGAGSAAAAAVDRTIDLGARPAFLVNDMRDGELKTRLTACLGTPPRRTAFSIGHRGAGIRYPEHTKESYQAGYRMGAGMLECDVTFTKDLALVCRHSQNDLATTTNILVTPLAATCVEPFRPAKIDERGRVLRAARAECRTSELTVAQFKTLRGKSDAFNPAARTPEEFVATTPAPRAGFEAGVPDGTLLTHAESIALFRALGVKMTPELKEAVVRMPFNGLTQAQLAQKLVDEYTAAGVDPADVFPQSFYIRDVRYWLEHAPAFGRQAVLLDDANLMLQLPSARKLARYKAEGINLWGAPLFALLTLDDAGRIVASKHAAAAKAAGLDIIAWTLERSGNLASGVPGFYYRPIREAITREGDVLQVIDVLARDVGVRGIFSDWAAPVTFYASCARPD